MTKWNIEESRELYNIRGWGLGYFDINNKGHIVVQPQDESHHSIDLKELVEDIQAKGYSLPALIRFSDILKTSITKLANAFDESIKKYNYEGVTDSQGNLTINIPGLQLEDLPVISFAGNDSEGFKLNIPMYMIP